MLTVFCFIFVVKQLLKLRENIFHEIFIHEFFLTRTRMYFADDGVTAAHFAECSYSVLALPSFQG